MILLLQTRIADEEKIYITTRGVSMCLKQAFRQPYDRNNAAFPELKMSVNEYRARAYTHFIAAA
ncbi:hypothetical protein PNH38_09750 [Anoxybacillus rupiensis]|jgi:hypothetical protein|uniref:Uncharacterized protein n=1 Tax=Anoxybacteroides rupiense TaxID=311460 RepID=A0ABT5W4F1_9BACL|nr:hypothetical protein [Anoxybacillus rupiensis]